MNKSNLFHNWPALDQFNPNHCQLPKNHLERGVIGKVDNAASDFRCIMKSDGFLLEDAKNNSYFGAQNLSADFLAWFVSPKVMRAIHVYPSRASDAFNRGNFLEKHFLEFQGDSRQIKPLLLYMLAMLKRIEKYRDEKWWEYRNDSQWETKEFSLAVSPDRPITTKEIKQAYILLNQAFGRLKSFFSKADLEKFYEKLLNDQQRLISFPNKGEILPVELILLLLLPLPIEKAAVLSFTMFFPSQRYDREKLLSNWDILLNFEFSDESNQQHKIVHGNQAAIYTQAIWDNSPEILKQKQILTKTIPETKKLIHKPIQKFRISLEVNPAPFDSSNSLVKHLYRYLLSKHETIPDAIIPDTQQDLNKEDIELIQKWHIILQKQYESTQDITQDILLKIEYFKSAYLFLCPNNSTLTQIGEFRTNKLSKLCFYEKVFRKNPYFNLGLFKNLSKQEKNDLFLQSKKLINRDQRKKMESFFDNHSAITG